MERKPKLPLPPPYLRNNNTSTSPSSTITPTINSLNALKSSLHSLNSKLPYNDTVITLKTKVVSLIKENKQLEEDNRKLVDSNRKLSFNLREMNPSYVNNNTSSEFPMTTELTVKINDFVKVSCQDFFFDCIAEYTSSLKQMSMIYQSLFDEFVLKINTQLQHFENIIKQTVCVGAVSQPIRNVLQKTLQIHFKAIKTQIEMNVIDYEQLHVNVMNMLGVNKKNKTMEKEVKVFLQKMYDIVYLCLLSTPTIYIQTDNIGHRVRFNAGLHESFDGFVSKMEWCVVLLPAFYKGCKGKEGIISKSQVVSVNYGNSG